MKSQHTYLKIPCEISKYLSKSQNILRNLGIYILINCEIPYSQKSHKKRNLKKIHSQGHSTYEKLFVCGVLVFLCNFKKSWRSISSSWKHSSYQSVEEIQLWNSSQLKYESKFAGISVARQLQTQKSHRKLLSKPANKKAMYLEALLYLWNK